MKIKKKIIVIFSLCVGLFVIPTLIFCIYIGAYLDGQKLKITDDISTSDSTLLQNEFGINLPSQAEITRFGYSPELIVIRKEGVADLPSFLTDSIHLELDAKDLEALTDHINYTINNNNQEYADMYGAERQSSFFLNSNYQTNPIDSSTITSFFLLDGKLIIEIKKTEIMIEPRKALKAIVTD